MQCKDFIGKPSGNPRKNFLQRGQVIILYALLIPLMFLFVGIGLDLGWYYLNVSRLQNAVDAAALAGATELVVKSKVTDIKTISLVDKYDDNPANIDTIDGDAVAAQYARENLSSDELSVPLTDDEGKNIIAYTLHDNWSIGGNSTVTMTTEIFKDAEENLYYVVHLAETVRHFFMSGWFKDMDAPVVSIALLSKSGGGGGGGEPEELTDKKIILDSNGDSKNPATLTDQDGNTGRTQRNVAVTVNEEDKTKYNDTQLPTSSNINLYRDSHTFIGWNTKADGTGTTYGNGRTFTSDELKALLGGNESVTLYAQWEEKIIYIAGDSLYNAMKGNSKQGTKGLEELMTYNTWVAINKLGKANAYGVYPDGGGSVYNSKGDHFRTETTAINPKKAGEQHNVDATNNFSIFLDLGSDLMYNNNASSGGNGLFRYSWDIADILNYNNSTLDSIVAKKNSFVSNNPSLTYNFTNNSSISKADAIKYRVHTRFNLDAAWTVRSKYYNSENYTSSKYVDYVRECLKTVLTALQSKYGTSKTISTISTLAADVDTIIAGKVGIPIQYSSYLTNIISSNASKTLSNTNINNIVKDFNPASMIPGTDPLYVRIESEELNEADGDRQNTTVRQMFINVNKANTGSSDRPLIIFYEGPDRGLTEGVDDSDKNSSQSGSPKEAYPDLSWRDSQPVILNLNADFSGILFAPNSPVAINGNGHNLHGFVVAKEFVRVTTESDYTVSNGKYIDSNGKEWFKSSQTNNGITNTVFVDEYGNVDTRPLDSAAKRPLGANETLAGEPAENTITAYRDAHLDQEVVYKLSAFNLGSDSYYDSFKIPELERHVYTYEDNYTDANETNSVDMFFTTVRSRWIT